MVFPLQRLPYLAQHEVVKTMKLEEILLLSICSRRTRYIVKQSVHRQSFKITFRNGFVLKLDRSNFDYIYFNPFYHTTWKASKTDFTTFRTLEFMSDVFNKPSVQLVLLNEYPNCTDDLQKVEKQELKLHSVYAQHDHIKFALENCRHAEELELYTKNIDISEVFKSVHPLCVDSLKIIFSDALNIDHIINIAMNCKQLLLLGYSYYNNHDVAKFIEAWKTSNSKLRYVEISHEGRLQNTLEKLDAVPIKTVWLHEELDYVRSKSLERRTYLEGECYLIQRQDGVNAVVYKNSEEFVLDTVFRIEQ